MLLTASAAQYDGPPRAPMVLSHGFEDGDSVTLCGEPLAHLFIFPDTDFDNPFLAAGDLCLAAPRSAATSDCDAGSRDLEFNSPSLASSPHRRLRRCDP